MQDKYLSVADNPYCGRGRPRSIDIYHRRIGTVVRHFHFALVGLGESNGGIDADLDVQLVCAEGLRRNEELAFACGVDIPRVYDRLNNAAKLRCFGQTAFSNSQNFIPKFSKSAGVVFFPVPIYGISPLKRAY